MKKQYVPVTLNAFLNESKSIMLKRKYGTNNSVVVGSNAPLRNQVLSYVSESARVSKNDLKRFIAGLNEGSKNPVAAATMWLARNSKFFITESKNGITYYKLSTIGKRLINNFSTNQLSESYDEQRKPDFLRGERFRDKDFENIDLDVEDDEDEDFDEYPLPKRSKLLLPSDNIDDEDLDADLDTDIDDEDDDIDGPEFDEDYFDNSDLNADSNEFKEKRFKDEDFKRRGYDFIDRKGGIERPGIYDEMSESTSEDDDESCETEKDSTKELDESSKARLKKIIETIRYKYNKKSKINESDEDGKKHIDEDDELTFDDLDLDDEKEEGKEIEDEGEKIEKEGEDIEQEGKNIEQEGEDIEDNDENQEVESKVEITEFVITVENVEEAISELSELGVTAEQVIDEEGEPIEDQIKVSADDWDTLKGWLEEKGVDIEEMFGGEIEVEDEESIGDTGSDEPIGEVEDEEGLEDLEDENQEDTDSENSEDLGLNEPNENQE